MVVIPGQTAVCDVGIISMLCAVFNLYFDVIGFDNLHKPKLDSNYGISFNFVKWNNFL